MLRLLNPERDGPALHAIFGDEECCTYLAGPATRSVAETVSLLKKWNEGTEETTWAILDSENGEVLGRATLIPQGRDVWEIGMLNKISIFLFIALQIPAVSFQTC